MTRIRRSTAAARPLRVLIVEDREDDLLLLLEELDRAGYEPNYQHVDNAGALRTALSTHDWEIVVSDFSLPTMTAHDVLNILRHERPDLPCIVMSGTITEESAVDVLTAGARDFVVKERMTRLVPAIEREVKESVARRRLLGAERTLQQTRERMQFVLETIGIGFWEWDVSSGTVAWSEVQERLHGLQPGSFRGTFEAFVDVMHPDDRADVLRRAEEAEQSCADPVVDYRVTWPDGSVHWITSIGRMTGQDEGGPSRLVGVAMDVTAQRLLKEQLQQAQKMDSIGNLAGGIAHDFNNLLTVIAGECELAAQRIPDELARESLDAVQIAARSATALTRQLLTFSRRQIVTPRLINLNETIHGFRKILRRLVEENVRIDFRLAPALRCVRADSGQIEQVLLNLVANARDAMPEGGTVTVETSVVTVGAVERCPDGDLPSGSYVRLSVVDTGFGMSPGVRTRLFEPFFTTKPVGRGTGLGLATVHGIVKESGGHIFVTSEEGSGSAFSVYLPVAADVIDSRSADGMEPRADLNGSETILVVEDNAPLRRLAERFLENHGYRVLVAANAAQARQICTEHSDAIALVLTDVMMPGDSGLSLAEWIRQQRPNAKIIYMSGYTDDRVLRQGYTFVPKPFTGLQLVRAVRDTLDSRAEDVRII